MKKIILSIMLLAGLTGIVVAQNIRFNGFAGYVFDDKIDSYYSSTDFYEGKIKGGLQWGGGLEFMVDETKGIEIKYLRRDATAPIDYYYNGLKFKVFDLAMNYILLGGSNYFETGSMVEPYAGAAAGVGIFTLRNAEASDNSATKFTWAVKLGTNIWLTEKVGLKLQADLLSAVQSMGGGLYFGTGGVGAGVNTYSTMYQIGIGGGLVFKPGK